MQRDALLELVPALIDKYGDVSSEAAAQWYEQVRDKWFADDDYEAVVADLIGHDALTSSVRAKANMLWPQDEGYDPEGYLRYLTEVVDRNVKRGGRDTIIANGRRDRRNPRFARVPSGAKTCAFCSMLASRGFVYLSEQTAGALGQYHADCDCEIIPSWDRSPKVEGYDPKALYEDYELARRQAGDNPTTADILAAMRRQPDKYTDGAQSKPYAEKQPDPLAKDSALYRSLNEWGGSSFAFRRAQQGLPDYASHVEAAEAMERMVNRYSTDKVLYRGMRLRADEWRQLLNAYEGEELNEHALSSWSSNPSIACDFASGGGDGWVSVVIVNRKGGKRLMSYDSAMGEKMGEWEYISSGQNQYKVVEVKESSPAELNPEHTGMFEGNPNIMVVEVEQQ